MSDVLFAAVAALDLYITITADLLRYGGHVL